MTLYHRSGAGLQSPQLPQGYWSMTTCLRSIVVTDQWETAPLAALAAYQVYRNEKAHEFLLQTVCGLHSPLLGETEVLGQFKDFVKCHRSQFSSDLNQWMDQVLREAKKIRSRYLQNLGCTSYGSLLRKHMGEGQPHVVFIGSGSLTQDILPWCLKKASAIQIFTRDPSKYGHLINDMVELGGLDQASQARAGFLVIAAPVSSQWLKQNLNLDQYQTIFDLRGESDIDTLTGPHVLTLSHLFADISANRSQAEQVKGDVVTAISSLVKKWRAMEKARPFGWEDLWTYS
jgi:glutamyl-tRNA reductase